MVFNLGTQEWIVIGLVGGIALLFFGAPLIKKTYKDLLGLKRDLKDIKDSHENGMTEVQIKK